MRLVNEQKYCNGNENFYENLFFVFSVNIERIHNMNSYIVRTLN